MNKMFASCSSFFQPIEIWSVNSSTGLQNMFYLAHQMNNVYDNDEYPNYGDTPSYQWFNQRGTFVVEGDQTSDISFIKTDSNLNITSTTYNNTNNATEIEFTYTNSILENEGLDMENFSSLVIYQFDDIPLERNGSQFKGYTLETFGSHIFKEGSMVIPGGTNYDYEYYSIKLESDHLGIPVSLYVENLKGKILKGQETGIRIKIDNYALPENSTDVTDLTLFVKYLDSGDDNEVSFMADGENLLVEESFIYGNTEITAGETVATLVEQNASNVGCSVSIADGVYFIRGHFVNVSADKIVLDPYSNIPNYRVGLFIQEQIVQAKDDSSLFDNARGFSNFAAPGADRLQIKTTLTKKPLTDFNDKNFVELVRLDNGQLKKNEQKPDYSYIKDYIAKRTYEESGNYSVGNFKVDVAECLNDGLSNEGVFSEGELTDQKNIPAEPFMCVKVSPGKAYVRGHDIEKSGTTVIDVDKPRDKEEFKSAKVNFKLGTLFKLNNVHGTPELGLNNNLDDSTILLRSQRKGSGNNPTPAGGSIGRARTYAFENTDAAYKDATTQFDLYLFDIQLFTTLTFNVALSNSELPVGSFVEGLSSGATGFAVSGGAGGVSINFDQVSGTFIEGETLIFNEEQKSEKASITDVISYNSSDILSVFQNSTALSSSLIPFSADAVLHDRILANFSPSDALSVSNNGSSTTGRAARRRFSGQVGLKVGNIIAVTVAWRGGTYMVKMFFPTVKKPSRKEVQDQVRKVYPGSKLVTYQVSEYDSGEPIIQTR